MCGYEQCMLGHPHAGSLGLPTTAYLSDLHSLPPECASCAHPRLCPQPQTPHLEEDLKEVLRSEAGIELTIEDDMRPEKQKRKPGVSGCGLETLTFLPMQFA